MERDAARAAARQRARRRRGLRRITRRGWTLLALATTLAGAVAYLGRPYGDELPPGTRIGGIAVGGRTPALARAAIAPTLHATLARTITLTSGSRTFPLPLRGLLTIDPTPIARIAGRDDAFWRRALRRAGVGAAPSARAAFRVDRPALHGALGAARRALETPTTPAGVVVAPSGDFRLTPSRAGTVIDEDAIAQVLAAPSTLGASLELDLRTSDPLASTADARKAIAAATTLLGVHHDVVLGGHAYALRTAALRAAIGFTGDDGAVRLTLAREPIHAELKRLFGNAEAPPRSARFTLGSDGGVVIEPSTAGAEVDPDALRHTLEADPARAEVDVRIRSVQPALTTAAAQALGVTDQVSEFTTPFTAGLPRVTNIRRAAELLNGHILRAGETFSLNEVLGRRTLERGFVYAPQIETGTLKDAVGGGVSQIATTLFNAAFFAGLRLDQHTPHEFYITRYPPGREATVSWGGPELAFTNDWPAPLVMLVDAGESSVTVRFFSRSLGRRIGFGTGEPTNDRKPRERRIKNPKLKPGARNILQPSGSDGFDITYWRKVYRGDALIRDETFSAHYKPEDRIVEVGPRKPKAKPKPPVASTTVTTG